jgi:hypothetical protein
VSNQIFRVFLFLSFKSRLGIATIVARVMRVVVDGSGTTCRAKLSMATVGRLPDPVDGVVEENLNHMLAWLSSKEPKLLVVNEYDCVIQSGPEEKDANVVQEVGLVPIPYCRSQSLVRPSVASTMASKLRPVTSMPTVLKLKFIDEKFVAVSPNVPVVRMPRALSSDAC